MENVRKLTHVEMGTQTSDGAGVKLLRVLGKRNTEAFDPFLMLDAFDSTDPNDYIAGFPWHPHRGIETITFLIKGDIEHGDSLGNKGSILDGDCQWMTAGSGIIHQEMPQATDSMFGTQLWLNLPAKDKMTTPKYNGLIKKDIPVVYDGKNLVHIISGQFRDTPGAFHGEYVDVTYLYVEMEADSEFTINTHPEDTLFVYILSGELKFKDSGSEYYQSRRAILFDKGDLFKTVSGNTGAKFLLLSGKPLKEPVAWGGPIVMNTYEELKVAFEELDNNTFIK